MAAGGLINLERAVYLAIKGVAGDVGRGDVRQRQQREANLGLTLYFPTGSIDERGATPMGPNMQLPYPMQLGSGTYDLEPSFT